MRLEVERRWSPRITTKNLINLLPTSIEGEMLNISETGLCFECDGPALSGDISLSVNLSPVKLERLTDISAKVIHHTTVSTNRIRYGAQFSFSNGNHLAQIRKFVFENFARKATVAIDNEDLKKKAKRFFNDDVKHYCENISALVQDISHGKIESEVAESRLTDLTDEILLKGNELEKLADNEVYMKKIKQVFREIAGCWFYKSPIVKMAYDKPRGYPGDYQLFEIIYDNKPQSEEGSLAYYCDRYFLRNIYGQAARARKNKMKNILQDCIENSNLETIKLLNIACGPSRDIRELFSDPYLASIKQVVFTGLDNDEEALKFSGAKLNHLPPNIQIRLLNENVLNIFRDSKYYDIIGKQDVIYILGLTEYLPDSIFRRLARFLFQLLNDNGMLVITYKDEAIEFPSLPPSWFCDWRFIKRTKEDLMKTAKEIGSDSYSLKIEREGTGTIYFFILTKKQN